jgi:7-carboxy-7-deazaguanine synthase (Cx14CxxC type)
VGTDGSGGGHFAGPRPLAQAAARAWQGGPSRPFVVLTGGEPLLQVDAALTDALRTEGFEIAVETNGTKPRPPGLDWVCVSPKASAPLVLDAGDELKLVYPQTEAPPERFEGLDFQHFLLQPLDGPDRAEATRACIDYCLTHPRWRLSVQMHKMVGVRLAT